MKLSAGNIAILLISAAITAFAFIKFMDYQKQGGGASSEIKSAGNYESDEELTKRLRQMDLDQLKEFVKEYIAEPLPEDYVIPQFIYDAGTPEEASKQIGERYPEFFGKKGNDYLHTIGKYPVRWKALINESKAYRKVYAHTKEQKSNN
jgi:hypothetical protein